MVVFAGGLGLLWSSNGLRATLAAPCYKIILLKSRMSGRPVISRWTSAEDYIYYVFLKLKESELKSSAYPNPVKMFDFFAHLVGTRSRHQVKSHHQKLMMKHNTIQAYIDYYQDENSEKISEYAHSFMTPKLRSVIGFHNQKEGLPKFIIPELENASGAPPEIELTHQDSAFCVEGTQKEEVYPSREDEDIDQLDVFWKEEDDASFQGYSFFL